MVDGRTSGAFGVFGAASEDPLRGVSPLRSWQDRGHMRTIGHAMDGDTLACRPASEHGRQLSDGGLRVRDAGPVRSGTRACAPDPSIGSSPPIRAYGSQGSFGWDRLKDEAVGSSLEGRPVDRTMARHRNRAAMGQSSCHLPMDSEHVGGPPAFDDRLRRTPLSVHRGPCYVAASSRRTPRASRWLVGVGTGHALRAACSAHCAQQSTSVNG